LQTAKSAASGMEAIGWQQTKTRKIGGGLGASTREGKRRGRRQETHGEIKSRSTRREEILLRPQQTANIAGSLLLYNGAGSLLLCSGAGSLLLCSGAGSLLLCSGAGSLLLCSGAGRDNQSAPVFLQRVVSKAIFRPKKTSRASCRSPPFALNHLSCPTLRAKLTSAVANPIAMLTVKNSQL
jgi:hypothetical protein